MPRSYPNSQSETIKSRASQAVANFLIRSLCSFLKSPRIRIAPSAGNQVIIERMLFVNTSVLVLESLWFSVQPLCLRGNPLTNIYHRGTESHRGRTEKFQQSNLKDLNQIQSHGNQQADYHHQCIILYESRLYRAHDRRH